MSWRTRSQQSWALEQKTLISGTGGFVCMSLAPGSLWWRQGTLGEHPSFTPASQSSQSLLQHPRHRGQQFGRTEQSRDPTRMTSMGWTVSHLALQLV